MGNHWHGGGRGFLGIHLSRNGTIPLFAVGSTPIILRDQATEEAEEHAAEPENYTSFYTAKKGFFYLKNKYGVTLLPDGRLSVESIDINNGGATTPYTITDAAGLGHWMKDNGVDPKDIDRIDKKLKLNGELNKAAETGTPPQTGNPTHPAGDMPPAPVEPAHQASFHYKSDFFHLPIEYGVDRLPDGTLKVTHTENGHVVENITSTAGLGLWMQTNGVKPEEITKADTQLGLNGALTNAAGAAGHAASMPAAPATPAAVQGNGNHGSFSSGPNNFDIYRQQDGSFVMQWSNKYGKNGSRNFKNLDELDEYFISNQGNIGAKNIRKVDGELGLNGHLKSVTGVGDEPVAPAAAPASAPASGTKGATPITPGNYGTATSGSYRYNVNRVGNNQYVLSYDDGQGHKGSYKPTDVEGLGVWFGANKGNLAWDKEHNLDAVTSVDAQLGLGGALTDAAGVPPSLTYATVVPAAGGQAQAPARQTIPLTPHR